MCDGKMVSNHIAIQRRKELDHNHADYLFILLNIYIYIFFAVCVCVCARVQVPSASTHGGGFGNSRCGLLGGFFGEIILAIPPHSPG